MMYLTPTGIMFLLLPNVLSWINPVILYPRRTVVYVFKKRLALRKIETATKETFVANCYNDEMREYISGTGSTAFKNLLNKIKSKAKLFGVDPPERNWVLRKGKKVKKFWLKAEALSALNQSIANKNITGIEEAIEKCNALEDYDFDTKNEDSNNAKFILNARAKIEQIKTEQVAA